ncbi:MAG: hypothetical protein ABIZ91_17680 [Gemmatimonadaceae bacterium]
MPRLTSFILLLCLAVCGPRLQAQQRELHWRTIASDARLDSTGRLHVRERQSMVFTGDWNGGERRFDVRLGQEFRFERIVRLDLETGAEHELREGDLSGVDEYAMQATNTLRWRSRLPSDPPFNDTELTYVLEYSYSNIVIPDGSDYYIDHDFAFSDRDGVIEQFLLTLAFDKAWEPPSTFDGRYTRRNLQPGDGFTVTVPLHYLPLGRPSGIQFGAPEPVRFSLVAILVGGVLVLIGLLLRRERALGRFVPLVPASAIDESWLREQVLHMLPEVVGATWDDTTGAPEVAAVLARLVSEKKLESSVTPKSGFFGSHVLHLTLLVDRSAFAPHERALIDALFTANARTTDTEAVQQRYASKGFDPASKIRPAIDRALNRSRNAGQKPQKPSRRVTLALLLAGVALIAATAVQRPTDLVRVILPSIVALLIYAFALSQASRWQKRMSRTSVHFLRVLVPVALLMWWIVFNRLLDPDDRSGILLLLGMVVTCLGLCSSIFNMAKSRDSAAHIALRKHLASAREYFRAELRKERPQLHDRWFPYFLAFGLGQQMDKWFRAFGGAQAATIGSARASSPDVTSSAGGPSWSGFGGGGAFSGGGSSGVWAAAAGSMAAGVSAPSSSSSGGGGGGSSGGGSSGGGGGGGW